MAIKPIDLQTNFLRTEQIGKEITDQKEAAAHNQIRQGEKAVQDSAIHTRQVTVADHLPDGAEKTKIDDQGRGRQQKHQRNKKKGEDDREEEKLDLLSDPDLGTHIDITG